MAVDTTTERKALIGLVSRGVVPTPDSSLSETDRALLAGFYDIGVAPPDEEPPDEEPPATGVPGVFSPPVEFIGPRVLRSTKGPERQFFRRASLLPVGISVLKINGVYQSVRTPTVDQTLAATEYYAGGHIYEVPGAVADALTAAGYTVNRSGYSNIYLETY